MCTTGPNSRKICYLYQVMEMLGPQSWLFPLISDDFKAGEMDNHILYDVTHFGLT
jgi:hypothetical protein